MQWQRTDDDNEKTPYAYRHKCLHEKLDLSDITDRYILGRAFYHIIQRRGFLSNRKDQGGDDKELRAALYDRLILMTSHIAQEIYPEYTTLYKKTPEALLEELERACNKQETN